MFDREYTLLSSKVALSCSAKIENAHLKVLLYEQQKTLTSPHDAKLISLMKYFPVSECRQVLFLC